MWPSSPSWEPPEWATVDQAWGPERSSHLGVEYRQFKKKRGAGWSEISHVSVLTTIIFF